LPSFNPATHCVTELSAELEEAFSLFSCEETIDGRPFFRIPELSKYFTNPTSAGKGCIDPLRIDTSSAGIFSERNATLCGKFSSGVAGGGGFRRAYG
jgi:hypothetical protein